MSTEDLFAPNGAFATDWLAQGAATDYDAPAAAAPSYDEDPLAFLGGNGFGGLDGYGELVGKGMHTALTQDELARALLGGFDVAGEGVGEMSSTGTSTGGDRSDAGSSPFSSGLSYSGTSAAPSTSSAAFDFDAVLAQSPSFAIPHNLTCDFDTTALQDLFTNSAPSASAGISARLSPFPLAPAPLQTLSPASSVSPYTAPLPAFPEQPADRFSTFNPAQLFAPSPVSGSSPAAPRLSVDFASPVPFASLSPSIATSASSPSANSQPSFTSLAATAGVSVPVLHAVPNPRSGPFAFSLNQESATTALLSSGARGRTTRNRAQVPPPVALVPAKEPALGKRAKSPMEVIANAGLQSEVHQAPLLQLRPNLDFTQPTPMSRSTSRKSTATGGDIGVEQEEQKLTAAKGGKKGKKADRGHNAVEQKYRNSINNALATLRDTIPALRHLKPLPSMPVSKRKASQFTLATAAVPETPTGLIDGVTAAKTLSKGVILTKAIEYIDYLRFARESRDADIELLKSMVRDMVGGGDALVQEFDRRRAALEVTRDEEQERRRAEDEEDGTGDEEEEEEDAPAPVPAAPAKGKKTAAGTKRGRKGEPPAAAKKMRGAAATASTELSPSLMADYRHVQALNQAHLDTLASAPQTQHVFPPSPVSSGDEQSISPSALSAEGTSTRSGGRVLLASFMGVSFAGGLGYDLAGSAVLAEETFGATAARVLTGRLARRSESATDVPLEATLVDRLHPSLLSGLVALGAATIIVALIYLVLPFCHRAAPSTSPRARRREQAVAALAAASPTDSTYGAARKSALVARKELLRLVDAPGPLVLLFALAKETLGWTARRVTGLTWGRDGAGAGQEEAEEAVAWVRIAEIETMVGDRISMLARLYTFLRLSNLSRSPTWPQVSPSTSRAAVEALLAAHLLLLGHPRWAEAAWQRMLAQRKKTDAGAGNTFVDLALANEWETVQDLLAPETRLVKAYDALAAASDTVPLLLVAESACEDAMKDAWSTIFVAVAETTAASPAGGTAAESHTTLAEADDTAAIVHCAMPEGSDLRTLAMITEVFLACYRAGTSTSPSSTHDLAEVRALLAELVLNSKSALVRLSCAAPLLRLLAPAVSGPLGTALINLVPAPAEHPSSDIDLLATVTLSWLLVRRQGAYVDRDEGEDEVVKPNAALHAQALAIRRLLGSELFSARALGDEAETDGDDDDEGVRVEDAKELLVDALTRIARRAAGLSRQLDEDSGVELEA
ncbi:hypothetical protein JCM3770_007220 [Rhodotorula araucariae]